MDYSHFALLLALIGVVVLIAEIFIPSGGVLSVVTVVCLGVSIYCAIRAWWGSNPILLWTYAFSLLTLIPATVAIGFSLLPHTSFGKRVLLEAPEPEDVVPTYAQTPLSHFLGRIGKTITPLTPGGLVLVDHERVHATSEGLIIERDQEVEIVEVRGNGLIVRPARGRLDDAFLAESDDESPLDFELPRE
jgi:membrane-bound ClpP family serine protease